MTNNMTLLSFYRDFFEPLKLRTRSARTKDLYEISLRHFDKFPRRAAMLSDLTDDTVSRYLSWFKKLPRAAASVNKERHNLSAVWRFACRKRFIDQWPDVEPENEPNRVPVAWTDEEINRLFSTVAKLTGKVGIHPESIWWTALLLVLWDTAERISAVLGILWADVDFSGGFCVCRAEHRKGGRKDRLYKLCGDTLEMMASIAPQRNNPATHVFAWPYHEKYIWQRYSCILAKAGLPNDAKSKFHRIRKTVASYCESKGGNATELLDHSRRSVTLAYLDPRIVSPHFPIEYLFRPKSAAHP